MKKISLLGLLILFLIGCREDVNEITQTVKVTDPPIIISEYVPVINLISGTVVGAIHDEDNNPVTNALVKMRNQTYTTDENGRFLAKDVQLDSEGTFFTVEKEGYFKGSRRFFPQADAISYATVELLQLNSVGIFDSNEGATLTGDDGLQITFPANAIKRADGTLYDGEVDVAAKWLDPSANNINEIMPGSLQGISTQLEEVSMTTYGMMAVELFGSSGESLNIADGQTAELSFPLPDEFLATAPAEIPLWSFEDQTYGLWVQEGSAQLVGNRYVGSVSHFSFWNCDAPFPLVQITGRVVTEDGDPLIGHYVSVCVEGASLGAGGYTNEDGIFSGKMPKNEILIFKMHYNNGCGGEQITFTFGPFTTDTDIGDLVISQFDNPYIEITGTVVDCAGAPITEGWLNYKINNWYFQSIYLDGTNEFSIIVLDCGNLEDITIQAVDITNLETSGDLNYTLSSPITDLGAVSACGSTLDCYFTLTIDGETTTFPNAGAIAELPATNEYLYIFANADTTSGNGFTPFTMTLTDGNVGMSDATNVSYLNISAAPPYYTGNYFLTCQGTVSTCVSTLNVDITVNTGQDGILEGTLNGTADFSDATGAINPDVPFSASFKLKIE